MDLNFYQEYGHPDAVDEVFMPTQKHVHLLNFLVSISMAPRVIHNPNLPQIPKQSTHKKHPRGNFGAMKHMRQTNRFQDRGR
jgi:hypothetical protein